MPPLWIERRVPLFKWQQPTIAIYSLAGQTFFVRNEEQAGISVPGRQQMDNKYKKRSVEDITMYDNTLELVGTRIVEDIVGNNGSTTALSSGGNIYPVVTTEADNGTQEPILETIDTQLVSRSIKVAGVKEIVDMMQISSVLEPVLMSNASRRGIPSHPDIPTSAPSSEAGHTTADTDKGEPRISENFTCEVGPRRQCDKNGEVGWQMRE